MRVKTKQEFGVNLGPVGLRTLSGKLQVKSGPCQVGMVPHCTSDLKSSIFPHEKGTNCVKFLSCSRFLQGTHTIFYVRQVLRQHEIGPDKKKNWLLRLYFIFSSDITKRRIFFYQIGSNSIKKWAKYVCIFIFPTWASKQIFVLISSDISQKPLSGSVEHRI